MTVEEARRRLGLDEIEEPFQRGWAASSDAFAESRLIFLRERFIREMCETVSLPTVAADRLVAAAERALVSDALCRLLWHEHRLFGGMSTHKPATTRRRFRRQAAGAAEIPFPAEELDPFGFPDLSQAVGEDAPALNLLIALSIVPATVSFYERRGLSRTILADTLSDFGIWYRYHARRMGRHGINLGTLGWLRNHLQGKLFRLGRLQFMLGSFPRDLAVYQRGGTQGRETFSETAAIASDGLTVDNAGLLVLGEEPEISPWKTVKRHDAHAVYGNPILPSGSIEHREVRLPFDEFLPVLEEGTPVLEVHIPEGPPLSPDSCAGSFRRAMEFFPSYFPERSFRAFTCESWFLGRELRELLPPDSNIARFAGELYLYPCTGGHEEAMARIFGPRYRESRAEDLPRDTTLRRRVADYVESGGRLRQGGGFILKEDLPWGRKVYQSAGGAPE